ncbi:hypothetical protein [Sandaracinobacteroides hominis]|uniref:hypothetical protein n=1 Tax=Sandaracinobacteroides hominis TaxID=2780086 RepID=UPI001F409118|nr:hypothetical protein [Sandaracinobacteroides hominis]
MDARFFISGQGAGKLADLLAVFIRHARMKHDNRNGIQFEQFGIQPISFRSGGGQNTFDLHEFICAIGYCLH